MKKFIIPIVLCATVLTLASCDESTQTVSYVDANGVEQTVELKATEDEEVVEDAIAYSESADYTEAEGIKMSFNVNGNLDVTGTEIKDGNTINHAAKANVSSSGEFETKDSVYYAQAQASVSYTKDEDSSDYTLSGNLYANLTNALDPYIYFDYTAPKELTGDETGGTKYSKVSFTDVYLLYQELQAYASQFESEYSEYFTTTNVSLATTTDTTSTFDEIKELLANLPNSKLVINDVNKDTYTLELKLSYNDLIDYCNENIENETRKLGKLDTDITIAFDFAFEVSTGLFKSFKASADLTSALDESLNSIEKNTNYTYYVSDFSYSFEVNFSYTDITVNTLSDTDKIKYTLIDLS